MLFGVLRLNFKCKRISNFTTCAFLVDGKWGKWSKYGKCSVTCGGGQRLRTRKCNRPKPAGGGKKCEGENQQTQECNTKSCGRK